MCRAGSRPHHMLPTRRSPLTCTAPALAEEQNASIFGHKGKNEDTDISAPVIKDEHPTRYRGMPDTPNERLVTVLQEALDVAGGMDEYLTEVCTPASEAAHALGKATEDADWSGLYEAGKTSEPHPHGISTPAQPPAQPCLLSPPPSLAAQCSGSRTLGLRTWSRPRRSRCSRTCSRRSA